MTAPQPRYPADRLADALHCSLWQMFDRIGVSGSTANDASRRGFTELQCDRYATKAGLSAYEVWPELREDVIRDATGLPPVSAVHALVSCLECGRPLTAESVAVEKDGRSGELVAVCPVGHRNVLRVEMEVAS